MVGQKPEAGGGGGSDTGPSAAELRAKLDSIDSSIDKVSEPLDTGGVLVENAGNIETGLEVLRYGGKLATEELAPGASDAIFDVADGVGEAVAGNEEAASDNFVSAIFDAAGDDVASTVRDLGEMVENLREGEFGEAFGNLVDAAGDIAGVVASPVKETIERISDATELFELGDKAIENAQQDQTHDEVVEGAQAVQAASLERLETLRDNVAEQLREAEAGENSDSPAYVPRQDHSEAPPADLPSQDDSETPSDFTPESLPDPVLPPLGDAGGEAPGDTGEGAGGEVGLAESDAIGLDGSELDPAGLDDSGLDGSDSVPLEGTELAEGSPDSTSDGTGDAETIDMDVGDQSAGGQDQPAPTDFDVVTTDELMPDPGADDGSSSLDGLLADLGDQSGVNWSIPGGDIDMTTEPDPGADWSGGEPAGGEPGGADWGVSDGGGFDSGGGSDGDGGFDGGGDLGSGGLGGGGDAGGGGFGGDAGGGGGAGAGGGGGGDAGGGGGGE